MKTLLSILVIVVLSLGARAGVQITPASASATASDNTILTTGLLAEYRFDEGSGTTLTDYSGNGNTGAYVGSPTFVSAGGFTSASGKYATGTTGALATYQTLYIAVDVPTAVANFNTILGNSTGTSSLEILTAGIGVAIMPTVALFPEGTTAANIPTTNQLILALVINGSSSTVNKMYFDGVEVSYATQNSVARNYRTGVPWFGNSSGGHRFDGNIYYFASYSTQHTAGQVAQNTAAIRRLMTNRGNALPAAPYASATTSQLVALGDSNTIGNGVTGWPGLISPIDTMNVINLGYPGTTSAYWPSVADSIAQRWKAPLAANIMALSIGTNDALAAKATNANVATICNAFRARGWTVVNIGVLANGTGESPRIEEINHLGRATWRNFADDYVDTGADPLVGLAGAASNATYFTANLHLTATGQTVWTNLITPVINRQRYLAGQVRPNSRAPVSQVFSQAVAAGVSVSNTTTETSTVGDAAPGALGHQLLTANITNTSTAVTALDYTGTLVVGQPVSGTGIAAATTIAALPSATTMTLSAAATATTTGVLLHCKGIGFKKYSWTPGTTLRVRQTGLLSTTGTPTLNKKLKLGSVVLATTGAVAMPSGITALPYVLEAEVTCVTIGASGTFWAHGQLSVQSAAGGAATVYPMTNAAVLTVDTTADALLDLTSTWGTASASNTELAEKLEVVSSN